jgi:hypothetical protein
MPINPNDGQFALDYWVSEDDDGDEETAYSDVVTKLEAEAKRLIRAERYKYLDLSRWNPISQDSDLIRSFEPD